MLGYRNDRACLEFWGVDCLDRLSGMFAFALWDRRRQMLFLVCYRRQEAALLLVSRQRRGAFFASEIAGLMANRALSTALSPTAIEDFLAYGYVPDPGSIYREISQLPAAHYLLLQRGRPLADPKPYWRPRFEAIPGLNEHDATEQLLDRLTQSVDRRLVADVPLGAFLSGGIDSGTIVALMAKLRADLSRPSQWGFAAMPMKARLRLRSRRDMRHLMCSTTWTSTTSTPRVSRPLSSVSPSVTVPRYRHIRSRASLARRLQSLCQAMAATNCLRIPTLSMAPVGRGRPPDFLPRQFAAASLAASQVFIENSTGHPNGCAPRRR